MLTLYVHTNGHNAETCCCGSVLSLRTAARPQCTLAKLHPGVAGKSALAQLRAKIAANYLIAPVK